PESIDLPFGLHIFEDIVEDGRIASIELLVCRLDAFHALLERDESLFAAHCVEQGPSILGLSDLREYLFIGVIPPESVIELASDRRHCGIAIAESFQRSSNSSRVRAGVDWFIFVR